MDAIIQPDKDPAVDELLRTQRELVPTLWLLGKTGSGKSSIVQRLTDDSRVEIGNGFAPCTAGANLYDHPQGQPVMRFLDTRGLGETDYNPHEDLTACQASSHALLIIMRVDEPDQTDVLNALTTLGNETRNLPTLLVHSARHAITNAADRSRNERFNEQQLFKVLGRDVPTVHIDFTAPEDGIDPADYGLIELREAIIDQVPALHSALLQRTAMSHEHDLFLARRKEVLAYAGTAAAIDLVPAVGLIAVPSIQGKLLHSLAQRYAVPWNARTASEFLTVLGSSFLYRYALSLMGRQLGKFIPVYGQSAGAAAAASISFASTYALGRAACHYLFQRVKEEPVDPDELRRIFRAAFTEQRRHGTNPPESPDA